MKRVLIIMEWLQASVGFLNFVVLTLIVSLQVLTRFVLRQPLLWSEELARFLLFWLVMNGAALAVKHGRHFTMEVFNIESIKNPALKISLQLIPHVSMLAVGIIMLVYGCQYAILGNYRIMPISQVNMMYVYAAIPLAGTLIAVYSICALIALFKTSTTK